MCKYKLVSFGGSLLHAAIFIVTLQGCTCHVLCSRQHTLERRNISTFVVAAIGIVRKHRRVESRCTRSCKRSCRSLARAHLGIALLCTILAIEHTYLIALAPHNTNGIATINCTAYRCTCSLGGQHACHNAFALCRAT